MEDSPLPSADCLALWSYYFANAVGESMRYFSPSLPCVICCLLFTLLFILLTITTQGDVSSVSGSEVTMLLYMLPGVLTCYLQRRKPRPSLFLGATWGGLLCGLIWFSGLVPGRQPWQGVAYLLGAWFWCVFGAVLVILYQHFTRASRH
jgi:hypothetical protein